MWSQAPSRHPAVGRLGRWDRDTATAAVGDVGYKTTGLLRSEVLQVGMVMR